MWKYVAGSLLVGGLTYGVIKYYSGGVCHCKGRLDGLVIIITGANSGIGKALAFELARRGATLVLACRNVKAALETKLEIIEKFGSQYNGQIFIKYLDLTVFESIFNFSKAIQQEFEEIYALVNNAGVFYHPHKDTVDGYDLTLQTNYLGPFALSHSLIRVLKKSEHSRIVNVTSQAHFLATEDDLKTVLFYKSEEVDLITAYAATKLALVLFSYSLPKKLSNTNISVNCADPGNVETSIFRHFPQLSNPWLCYLQWPIRKILVKSPKQGCQSILHLLLTPKRITNQYIVDCKPQLPSKLATKEALADIVYNKTLKSIDKQFVEGLDY